MSDFFIDIETVPNLDGRALAQFTAEAAERKAEIKAPSNYKDPAKISEYIEAKQAEIDLEIHERVLKTSFDGALGHIAVIGVAIDDAAPIAIYEDSKEPHKHEAKVLTEFFELLKDNYDPSRHTRPRFIGHNITNFDLRFIFQRAVVLGIRPPSFIPFQAKPWDDTIYDTMTAWAGFKGSVKMDALAKALGLPGKQGIDGSQVWPLITEGRIKEVADYCAYTDVAQTRDIYRRLTFQMLPETTAVAA